MKREDVIFSGLAVLIVSPVLLLAALAVMIDEPHGSPIFKQLRCGRDGKKFYMYEFRSMYMDAEKKLEDLLQANEMDGPVFNIAPRIMRVGKFIRKTSIDELLQLWNILKDDMRM